MSRYLCQVLLDWYLGNYSQSDMETDKVGHAFQSLVYLLEIEHKMGYCVYKVADQSIVGVLMSCIFTFSKMIQEG